MCPKRNRCVGMCGVVRQLCGLMVDGPVGVADGMGLSSLVGISPGCTALMRANSPKHPPGCLQLPRWIDRDKIHKRRLINVCFLPTAILNSAVFPLNLANIPLCFLQSIHVRTSSLAFDHAVSINLPVILHVVILTVYSP